MVFLELLLQFPEMVDVVDLAQIPRVDVVPVIEGFLGLLEQDGLELLVDLGVNVNMVGCDTGLSTVDEFAEYESNCSTAEISCFINDHWTFAPQLQDAGRQVLGSLDGDQPSRLGRSSEADHVERQLSESLAHLHLPLQHSVEPCLATVVLGSRCFSNSFFSTLETCGANSLGLSMTQLPAEIAAAT